MSYKDSCHCDDCMWFHIHVDEEGECLLGMNECSAGAPACSLFDNDDWEDNNVENYD